MSDQEGLLAALLAHHRDPKGSEVRGRLRRVREAIEHGRTLDPRDAAFLVAALRQIDEQWPTETKKRAEEFGRLFALAFGLAGRREAHRSLEDDKPYIAMAREMMDRMASGESYQVALAAVAEAIPCSESTVARAYTEHKDYVARYRSAFESSFASVAKIAEARLRSAASRLRASCQRSTADK